MWHIEPMEVVSVNGVLTGHWRLTALSIETGARFSDGSHTHKTPDECLNCPECIDYVASKTGVLDHFSTYIKGIFDENDKTA